VGAGFLTRALNSLRSSGGRDVAYESFELTTKGCGLLDARGSSLSGGDGGSGSGGGGGSGVNVHLHVPSAVVAEEAAAEANAQELAHAAARAAPGWGGGDGGGVMEACQRQVRSLSHYCS
jgi:hypothetical protein